MISENAKPTRSLDAQPQIVSEDLYLVKGNDAFQLGESEAVIWRLCDGSNTVAEIADAVAQEFDAPEMQIIDDVKAFVLALKEAALVSVESGE